MTSANTTITADGTINCKNLKAVNADLEGTFKNVSTTSGGITMTTTLIGGEYLMKSNTGAYLQIQGHIMQMSDDTGSTIAWQLGRANVSFNVETYLNSKTYINTYDDLEIYHPSLERYMQPALSRTNPITFEWTGSALRVWVDNVHVGTLFE